MAEAEQPVEPAETRAAGGTYAVIDGNSLMHRAFHAIPPSMNAPDGRPTNALFGFVSMLLKLMEDFRPDGVVVAFDKGAPQVRIDMLPQYKAQRPPRDPLLSEQFPMVHELLDAMSVPVYAIEGWEGDDLLGTMARQGEAMGCEMLLVTGDRDSYQLASEHVRIVATKKGISDVVVYGPSEVAELYEGVTPAQIPDFYGLKGDTSDNIPGVPGIGPKKASALIVQYGSLDAVIEHAGEIKGKMGENIRAHVDDALVSRRVARIRTDAPVAFDPQEASWPDFDPAEVERAFDALGFTALKRRVLAVGAQAGAAACAEGGGPSPASPNLAEEALEGAAAWGALEAAAEAGSWVGVHVDDGAGEGTLFGLDTAAWFALEPGWELEAEAPDACAELNVVDPSDAAGRAADAVALTGVSFDGLPIPAGRRSNRPARVLRFEGDDAVRALALAYGRARVSSFSVKEDLHRLVPVDSSEPALLDMARMDPCAAFDVAVAAYLLDSNRSDYGIDALVRSFLPWELPALSYPQGEAGGRRTRSSKPPVPEPDSVARRCAAAAAAALALRPLLSAMLAADGSLACMGAVEMPLTACLVVLERNGMNVSRRRLLELSAELDGQIGTIKQRIYDAAGGPFNIDSPAQLSSVLFDTLGLPTRDPDTCRPLKKTKKGFYSTNAKMLESFAGSEPVVADVLDYRERVKIKSTYLDTLPLQVQGDGRVHTTYNQTVTATGRLSSSDPNLQNIPVRSELGRMVRTAFVPADADSVILSCDYSQIELRLLAHLSEDPGLIDAFTNGEDFHAETAARVFGIDPSEVTPEQRSRAKAVNFGIVYGQTAWGLSQSLKISSAEAQDMIDRYYRTYPRVRGYLDEQVDFAREHGWVATMFGRKRHVPDIHSRVPNVKQFAERTAMNHPMQGSAADIIKLAMARVQARLFEEGFRARMIVQVHDELDFDCPKDEVEDLSALVRREMQGVVDLRVPLIVSCATGENWAEAK